MEINKSQKKIKEIINAAENNKKEIRQKISDEADTLVRTQREQAKKEKLKIFADNLRRYREQKKLNRNQFGALLGLKPPNYYPYEAGTQEPGALLVMQITNVLGITINDLFSTDQRKQETEGMQCQIWFTAHNLEATYDGNDTLILYPEGLPPETISITEAKDIIKISEQKNIPTMQDTIITEIFRAIHKRTPGKKAAGELRQKK